MEARKAGQQDRDPRQAILAAFQRKRGGWRELKPEERTKFEHSGRPARAVAFERGHLEQPERLALSNDRRPADDLLIPLSHVQEVLNERAIDLGWALAAVDWQDESDAEIPGFGYVVLATFAPLGRRLAPPQRQQIKDEIVEHILEAHHLRGLGARRIAAELNTKMRARGGKNWRPPRASEWNPRTVTAVLSSGYAARMWERMTDLEASDLT